MPGECGELGAVPSLSALARRVRCCVQVRWRMRGRAIIIMILVGALLGIHAAIVARVWRMEMQLREMDSRLGAVERNNEHQQRSIEAVGWGVMRAERRIIEIDDLLHIGGSR